MITVALTGIESGRFQKHHAIGIEVGMLTTSITRMHLGRPAAATKGLCLELESDFPLRLNNPRRHAALRVRRTPPMGRITSN